MSNKCLNHVIEHSEARGSARLVLILLADMANDDGECYPGKANLALKARMQKRNLHQVLQKLELMGELTIFNRRDGIFNKTNLYKIYMGGDDLQITRGSDPTITRVVIPRSPGSDLQITRGGDLEITRSLKESLIEPLSDPEDIPPPENAIQKMLRERRERPQ